MWKIRVFNKRKKQRSSFGSKLSLDRRRKRVCAKGLVRACVWLQPHLTLCCAMDHSPPGSAVQGILQARTLEWVAKPSCRGSSRPRDHPHLLRVLRCRWVLYLLSRQASPCAEGLGHQQRLMQREAHTAPLNRPNPQFLTHSVCSGLQSFRRCQRFPQSVKGHRWERKSEKNYGNLCSERISLTNLSDQLQLLSEVDLMALETLIF